MATLYPVVLSGGVGTRLWPVSRALYPKQLQPLVGERTMLQETILRLPPGLAAPVVVCNDEHRFIVASQLQEAGYAPTGLILEPAGRNTAPAVALAAFHIAARAPHARMLVLPADHHIAHPDRLARAIAVASSGADRGRLVTFGIRPDRPETGYGYIQRGEMLAEGVEKIERFVEKPDLATAETYLADGHYVWNSGMFLFRVDTFLSELARHAPDIHAACADAMAKATRDLDFTRPAREPFLACRSESIDYAVMEVTDLGAVVPVDLGWSDIGSWSALRDIGPCDDAGNRVSGDVVAIDSSNCLVRADSGLVATAGVKDLVVVATGDAVLVADARRAQDVKHVVDRLKAKGRSEHVEHQRVLRPWGWYQTIDRGERFQVKHLMVHPGAALSLQMHHHRAEHWVVVRGTAKVVRGDDVLLLSENESTYIPVGMRHRLENPGKVPLSLIEVQSGGYLGEDDIVRFEDVYDRVEAKDASVETA